MQVVTAARSATTAMEKITELCFHGDECRFELLRLVHELTVVATPLLRFIHGDRCHFVSGVAVQTVLQWWLVKHGVRSCCCCAERGCREEED